MKDMDEKKLFENDEINLYVLFITFWDSKWLISSITIASCIFIVLYSLSIPNIYRSSALVMPAQSQGSSMSSSLSGLGGLASMAGISIPSGNSNNKEEAIAVLTSHQFLEDFIINNDILLHLMASKGWDAKKNELILNSKIYDIKNKKWAGKTNTPPSIQEAVRSFRQIYIVSENKKNGFVTISIDFYSPYVSKEWIDLIIENINETMRVQAVSKATSSLNYLNEQISKTNISEIKIVLSELAKSETQKIMLSKSSPEYVFKTIDKAFAPEIKISPRRSIICIIGALIGFSLSLLISILLRLRKEKHNS
jgi:LPS O-antigen subunit length determinant protein (WzzB/FepE family)